ncbi:fluoride efflux transporter CrcB [Amycolatopsis silviterrae]|uniref:Fluoride-specific ion channel FluC n=1 Tax=Amycolatopsis silviterrae TaxID=1656914 RepID=A0ABW5HNS0_9PSEU
MNAWVWAGVLLIGGAGSVLRFLVDGFVAGRAGKTFPFGTLAVNLSGSVLLGIVAGAGLGPDAALLAGTAAVGSYTTFSTWMLETHRVSEERQYAVAFANIVLSLVFGIAGAALGRWIGSAW